jgi:hypothetical protein
VSAYGRIVKIEIKFDIKYGQFIYKHKFTYRFVSQIYFPDIKVQIFKEIFPHLLNSTYWFLKVAMLHSLRKQCLLVLNHYNNCLSA